MSSRNSMRRTRNAWWKGAAVLTLAVAVLGGSGCARQEIVQASDVPAEAPVVTVRTLSTRPRVDKKRLALNVSAKSAVAAEEPKAEPKPRRRRRARPRKITPAETQAVTPAAPRDSAPEKEAFSTPPAEPIPAAPRPAATPEHVIEPRPPAAEPKSSPDAPTVPEADPTR